MTKLMNKLPLLCVVRENEPVPAVETEMLMFSVLEKESWLRGEEGGTRTEIPDVNISQISHKAIIGMTTAGLCRISETYRRARPAPWMILQNTIYDKLG